MFVLTNTPKEFIPESQKDQQSPLTFIWNPPARKTVLDLQELLLKTVDENGELDSAALPLSKIMELYLEACVTGWKNIQDAEGNEILFTPETFKQFADVDILTELYNFVKELTESNPNS